ncbi:MAG: hypothetical protein LBO69_00310 [Ignavibacteria bacterium]|jgi:hypothetical protein|nr:hypothetical protein [Ignavibacteria bacterium]
MIKTIVKKVLWGVVSPALLEVSTHNIAKEMQYRALTSSTDFVLENMKGIDYVNTNFQLLKLAVKCITINGLFLEFGVFNGTSINFLSKIVPTRGGGGGAKYLLV